jgi:tetratricopeptide (TPR) repeat protein
LREELQLHQDIEAAVQEHDLMDLRNQLSNIIQSETSWDVSEQSIEDFIDGILEGEDYNEFVSELNDNIDLRAEVKLREQINNSIGEKDIMELRGKLKEVREVSEVKKVKMLVPETKTELYKYVRNSVAVIILLIGIGGILSNSLTSEDKIYNSYFDSPSWSAERSVSDGMNLWQSANYAYLNDDWQSVINYMDKVDASAGSSEYAVAKYRKAVSLQNLNKYEEAITEYSKVIQQGDNLFVEEAEWYRSLCYIKLGKKEQAKQELLAVIERKGSFENDAKAVLRKLRYSFK